MDEREKRIREQSNIPGHIHEHSPEHKKEVCKFLGIPVEEYDEWRFTHNYVAYRRWAAWSARTPEDPVKPDTPSEPERQPQ